MKTEKNRRFGIILVLLILLSQPMAAQLKYGIKADVGLSSSKFNSDLFKVENLTSYSIGPSIEAMIFPLGVADLGLEASLLYNDSRMTVKQLTSEREDLEITNRYLNLPINAKIKFGLSQLPIRFFAVAGPNFGYLIQGNILNIGANIEKIKAKEFQAGVNIGLGIELIDMIQLGVNWSVKLTDNYSVEAPNWKDPLNGQSDSWSIGAAIYF